MNQTFGSILSKPASQVERPKPAPIGSYHCMVMGMPKIDKSSKKQTEYSEYTLKVIAPLDDVDPEALGEWLTKADGEKTPIQDKTFRVTFYHTEGSLYRLKEFLENCGIEADDDTSIGEMINSVPNCEVIAKIKHTPSDDGKTMYANVSDTAKVD